MRLLILVSILLVSGLEGAAQTKQTRPGLPNGETPLASLQKDAAEISLGD